MKLSILVLAAACTLAIGCGQKKTDHYSASRCQPKRARRFQGGRSLG